MLQQLNMMPSTLSARQRPKPLDTTADQWLKWILGAGIVVSILSFIYFFQQGITTDFYDAGARMLITRRVVDSPTPGLAQLGAVWLPLTHIAALPFIGIDWMYQTGIAGSLVSMASFVDGELCAVGLLCVSPLHTAHREAGCRLSRRTGLRPQSEHPLYAVHPHDRAAHDCDGRRGLLLPDPGNS